MGHNKFFLAFVAVGSAGLLLLAFSRLAPPRNPHYEVLLTPPQFMALARDQCAKVAKPIAGVSLSAPTEMLGDGKTYAQINWRAGREVPDPVSCRFERGRGVTDLKVGGKSFPVSSGETLAPSPGVMMEKHWGHW